MVFICFVDFSLLVWCLIVVYCDLLVYYCCFVWVFDFWFVRNCFRFFDLVVCFGLF